MKLLKPVEATFPLGKQNLSVIEQIKDPYRRLRGYIRHSRLVGPRIMLAFGKQYPSATFVQIGSNDGKKHDPIYKSATQYTWHGVMVEPVPYVFERLQRNYRAVARVTLENVAVADVSGSMPFYYVKQAEDDSTLPDWYDELGSFKKEVILKHSDRVPDLESRLVRVDVPCVTFGELCERNGIVDLDLIHMDTEGYDFELIKSIDFDRWRPKLLIYEHKHLSDSDRESCRNYLLSLGFGLLEEGQDTWCVDMTRSVAGLNKYLHRFSTVA